MNLQEYIKAKYNNEPHWFVELVNEPSNQMRINDVLAKKEYLNGNHAILNTPSYEYKGVIYNPRRIVLQYANTLLDFQKAFLLANPVTYTGNEEVVKAVNNINRKGKFDRLNIKLMDKLLKFGEVYEYIYIQDDKIKSKVIDTSEGYPLYDHNNEQLAFVQHYVNDGIGYYIIYDKDTVTEYNNEGGEIHFVASYPNLSGLPVIYRTDNDMSETKGKSELDSWIHKLDEMENLISKFTDTVYKNMNPLPIAIGMDLKDEPLQSNIVGQGLRLEDGADFKYASVDLDVEAFNTLYEKLLSSLLDISSTPEVSMNRAEVSNISETSIKILFYLGDVKAKMNEVYMRDGFEERLNKFRKLLALQGKTFTDDDFETLNMTFQYNLPSNDTEIINNLKTLNDIGGVSLESLLEKSPYTNDTSMELQRLSKSNVNTGVSDVVTVNEVV